MRYKLLGMLVWKGGRIYARRRLHRKPSLHSGRAALGGLLGLAAVGAAASAARRRHGGATS